MNSLKIKIILFLSIFIINVNAQESPSKEKHCDVCQQLLDGAIEDTNNKKYEIALEKLLKAESLASENLWHDQLWRIKNSIGIIYANTSNFGEALDYFQDSYNITQKYNSLRKNGGIPLENIGALYSGEKKYEEGLYYMEKAYDIFKKSDAEDLVKKRTSNNLASIYNELGNSKKSLKILEEVRQPVGDKRIDFLWKAIYIKALFVDGQILKARNMADELYRELDNSAYDDKACHSCLNDILSKIYAKLDDTDMAIQYSKLALNSTDELIDRIDFYNDISNLYLRKKEYETALQYKDSVIQTKDSLSVRTNRNLYEANKVKFKVSEFQNELNAKKKQQQTERKLFIMAIVLCIITLFSIYKALRNRGIKQKQDALLKQELLKNDIAEKNRALSARTLYLTNRNELINDIINSLETDNKITQSKDTTQQIKTIKNFLKTDIHQEDFIKHFESVNPIFLKKLKEQHQKLTTNDIRFLCYIFMNLSLKEISIIFNITYDACRVRRNRIAEKMDLDLRKISLYDYLLEFV